MELFPLCIHSVSQPILHLPTIHTHPFPQCSIGSISKLYSTNPNHFLNHAILQFPQLCTQHCQRCFLFCLHTTHLLFLPPKLQNVGETIHSKRPLQPHRGRIQNNTSSLQILVGIHWSLCPHSRLFQLQGIQGIGIGPLGSISSLWTCWIHFNEFTSTLSSSFHSIDPSHWIVLFKMNSFITKCMESTHFYVDTFPCHFLH
jgi:hypothetical protein